PKRRAKRNESVGFFGDARGFVLWTPLNAEKSDAVDRYAERAGFPANRDRSRGREGAAFSNTNPRQGARGAAHDRDRVADGRSAAPLQGHAHEPLRRGAQ